MGQRSDFGGIDRALGAGWCGSYRLCRAGGRKSQPWVADRTGRPRLAFTDNLAAGRVHGQGRLTNEDTFVNLGFLASHDGTNMQAIIDACRSGTLPAMPAVVISNNSASGALVRAKYEGLPNVLLNSTLCCSSEALDQAIVDVLVRHNVDIVVLAGYMRKLGPKTLRRFAGAILNVHPALLPKYGGKGMYGLRVHEAVLASGDRETGATIHLVDEEYDTGPILAQFRVPVQDGDTATSLAERVRSAEHKLYPEVLAKIASGGLRIPGYDRLLRANGRDVHTPP